MASNGSLLRTLTLAATDAIAVRVLWPQFPALGRDLTAPQAWVARVGGDRAVTTLAGTALWLVGLWLAVGLAAALLSYAPGAAGELGRHFAQVALPRALYRAAAGAAGLGVLLSPLAAAAAGPPHPGIGLPPVPAPNWPSTNRPAPTLPQSAQLPQPTQPRPQPIQPRPQPIQPRPRPTQPAPRPTHPQHRPNDVVVQPGDSLWSIAAAQLPANASATAVAGEWPRWYALNRAEIGPDPSRLTPGELLHRPEQETP